MPLVFRNAEEMHEALQQLFGKEVDVLPNSNNTDNFKYPRYAALWIDETNHPHQFIGDFHAEMVEELAERAGNCVQKIFPYRDWQEQGQWLYRNGVREEEIQPFLSALCLCKECRTKRAVKSNKQ